MCRERCKVSKFRVEIDFNDKYEVLESVAASQLDKRITVGRRGFCRFCHTEDPKLFRHTSHLFPEFLGNKRIISLDECDLCNSKFKIYDSNLAAFFTPYLTLVH